MTRAFLVQPLCWYYDDCFYQPEGGDDPPLAAFATWEQAEAYRRRLDRQIACGERPAPPGQWLEASGPHGYLDREPFSHFEVIEIPWVD